MLELIVLILAVTFNLLLGFVVLKKNTGSATNRFFFMLTLAICLWSTANFISVHPGSIDQLLLARLVLFFAALLNLCVFLTFRVFPDAQIKSDKRLLWLATIATAAVMIATLTPIVFSSLVTSGSRVSPNPGPGIGLFGLQTAALLGGAVSSLVARYRLSKGLRRLQFKYVLLGFGLTFTLILFANFILVAAFHNAVLLPFGASFTLIFSSIFTYAIVKQRLFDIRAIVAKSVMFSLLIGTMAIMYGVAIFATTQLIFPNANNSTAQTGSYTALAIILALTFQPLRRFFERVTDRIFFRDRYDPQSVLDDLSKILVSEIELAEIMKKSLTQICTDMRIGFGQLVIFNNGQVYRIEHFGDLPQKLVVAPQLRKLNHGIIVADDLDGGDKKAIMDDHGIRVSAMLRTRDELVGYLLLGDKLSGETYTHGDIELLQIVAKELAVASQNAKAYAEIQAFNLTLQERVSHATNRLRVANRHLKELDQAKDEFISMASHQLRTPLTTIKGYLSMMLEGDAGEITDTQRQFTGYAFEGADRMVNLIADLLNVSRLSAGRFMIEARPSDLGKIVEDEVRQLQSHAVAKNLELVYHAPKRALPLIPLDDNKTRQVIMNFIDNAIYYTKEGSITVAVTKVDTAMRLTVRDTGIGVPLDARRKLFSKFYRADNAQTVRPDGTGLGLYLAKRVIEDQGGTIIFESVEGKGSTFGFELPLSAAPAPAPTPKKVSTL
jgi:signal transduction histidine kinase